MTVRRREKKRVHLGEKVLRAQIAWLDAPLRWSHERGQLTWGGTVPDADLLWRTQKRLYALRGVERQQSQLERAKRWLTLRETDEADWLVIEALCENELPFSPSACLAQSKTAALPALQALEDDPLTPGDALPLIRLIKRVCQGEVPLPRYPDLVARMGEDAPGLATLPLFTLTPQSVRQALRSGQPAAEQRALIEELMAVKPLVAGLEVDWEPLPPESIAPAVRLLSTLQQRELLPVGEDDTGPLVRCAPAMHEALPEIFALDTRPEWLELLEKHAALLWPQPEFPIKKRLTPRNRARKLLEKAQQWRAKQQLTVERLHQLVVCSQNLALAGEVLESGSLWIMAIELPDPALYALLWSLQKEFKRTDSTLVRVFRHYRSVAEFRADFGELLRLLRRLPEEAYTPFFEALITIAHNASREKRRQLPRLASKLPQLLPLTQQEDWETWDWLELFRALPMLPEAWLPGLVARLTASVRMSRLPLIRALAGDNEAHFHALLDVLLPLELDWVPFSAAERFCEHLPRFPELQPLLIERALKHPRKAIELLAQLGEALRLGLEALQPLQGVCPDDALSTEGWEEILALLPGNSDVLWCAPEPPTPGMLRALALPERLRREASFLAAHPERAQVRRETLEARLADPERLLSQVVEELQACVAEQAQKRRFAALDAAIQEVYRVRLRSVIGSRALSVEMTPDVMNAALLSLDIDQNRRLLIRLLRAYCDGDIHWPLRQKANLEYLKALSEHGVDSVAWRGCWEEHLRCDVLPGGWLNLQLETDPLAVLQMGNYFDTCLSFGGCNAFSTVANACDANKRVLYARDGKGRIVARQLLALTETQALVGFSLYSTVEGTARAAIAAQVNAFVERFAQRCGLTLAVEGSVVTLLASHWYDDGVVPWENLTEPHPQKTKRPGGSSSGA